jgi:sec-independent protein translocase protein TatA
MLVPLIVGGLGPVELFIIMALIVLLFGAKKLPELARASGQAMGEFQRGRAEIEDEIRSVTEGRVEDEVNDVVDDVVTDSAKTA